MKFRIEITETLQRTVKIEAPNADAAIVKAKQLYREEKIILDDRYYIDTGFDVAITKAKTNL